ncbi:hypothetical protein J3B02_002576 [Coemansia erecta]|uniref:CHCH domain-containing protein n=1 Tax=Coemansia asiatica TaxID=1052880 RepID=A0A9W7XNQ0_9FUNG|nr:hypothetical protein LPJ64_002047 [Coemansia asiatica]KAJ2854633.1 hypothetical protein J3B02_002576 [Coemansia erecta]KAJ2888066.1 hypothetical protein FB639_000891 [Coemansia asiatica]
MTYFKRTDLASKEASLQPESKETVKNSESTSNGNSDNNNDDDDDEDAWDKRIKTTGCFKENEALLICHADTGDWRKCLAEMSAFKQCMKRNGRFSEDP